MTEYQRGLIDGAMYAVAPWRSIDAERTERISYYDDTTQADKEFCFSRCPYTDCVCDHCDGHGNVKRIGRPRKAIDRKEFLDSLKKASVEDVCRKNNISRATFYRVRKEIYSV